MKLTERLQGNIALFITCLLAAAATWLLCAKSCKDSETAGSRERQREIANTPVKHYKDDNGTEHAQKGMVAEDYHALIDYYASVIDSQAALLKVKPKYIKGVVAAGIESNGSINGTVEDYVADVKPCPDSLEFNNAWDSISVREREGIWMADYKIRDSIVITQFLKKKGWFKKELILDAYSLNPNTRITGLTGVKIDLPKPKRFGIGPVILVTYKDGRFVPVAGIGAQFNLIRF
jgi:hypothetical protein